MFETIQSIDFSILDFLRFSAHTSFGDKFFPFITIFGNPIMFVFYVLLLLVVKKTRREGIMCACGIGTGALICNVLLKNIVQRARPCWLHPEVELLIETPKDYSFPSGHTMAMVILSVILIYKHPKLAWGLVPFTLLIMYSRLYLYVHFPSDVLFSLIVGFGIGALTCYVESRISKKSQPSASIV